LLSSVQSGFETWNGEEGEALTSQLIPLLVPVHPRVMGPTMMLSSGVKVVLPMEHPLKKLWIVSSLPFESLVKYFLLSS
jgi:hypothetical protein